MLLKSIFPQIYKLLRSYNLKEDEVTSKELFYISDILTEKGDIGTAYVCRQLAIAYKDLDHN